MLSDGTFGDGTSCDGTFGDGTFCMGTKPIDNLLILERKLEFFSFFRELIWQMCLKNSLVSTCFAIHLQGRLAKLYGVQYEIDVLTDQYNLNGNRISDAEKRHIPTNTYIQKQLH